MNIEYTILLEKLVSEDFHLIGSQAMWPTESSLSRLTITYLHKILLLVVSPRAQSLDLYSSFST